MTKRVIPGNNALQVDPAGNVIFLNPHGTFYSLATQAIADPTASPAQRIALELDSDVNRLGHSRTVNNSRIYAESTGSYGLLVSGIANITGGTNKHLEIWLAIDGTDVPDTNTRVQIAGTVETTVCVDFIFDLNAGSYVELVTWGDDNTCEWLYTAEVAASAGVTPYRPASPSIVVSMKKVSSYLPVE